MMIVKRTLIYAALMAAMLPAMAAAEAASNRHSATEIAEGQSEQPAIAADGYKYLLHIPQGYSSSRDEKWPAIIFLHGSGERGDDLDLVKIHGPPKLVGNDPAFPFIVISPQLPAEQDWDVVKLDQLLDAALLRLRADPARIYLTGLSRGGTGTWRWAAARPDRFAAIAPVAGRTNPSSACAIKDIPTWVFHGDSDPLVPTTGSIDMVSALRQCGGQPLMTIYPSTGHDSWTQSYANPALYLWFLRHRLHSNARTK